MTQDDYIEVSQNDIKKQTKLNQISSQMHFNSLMNARVKSPTLSMGDPMMSLSV